MTALHYLSLAELAVRIRARELRPQEVLEHHLKRIEKLQPDLNAFVQVDAEGARRQSQRVAEALLRGRPVGSLNGVPLTVKSSIDVAGWPCAAGSLLRQENRPSRDAVLVERLRRAGAVLLGNTTTPEFLMAYETDNRLTGKTRNPWNCEFSSGGSSGGEAAAIASGCCAGGIGSDGGGSIRVPATFCGVCGLKPTPGRIPSTGHYPPGNSAFGWLGVVGPMARTVGDLRILFAALAGPDPGDALSSPVEAAERPKSRKELRIGILEGDGLGTVTPETQLAVRKAAQLLAQQGFELQPFRLNNLERVLELWWFFFGTVVGQLLEGEIRGREELISPLFEEYLEAARPQGSEPVSMLRFVEMCAARDRERQRVLEAMGDLRLLLSPVCAAAAFRHGAGNYRPGSGYRDTMRHSQWLNLTGFPGVAVPMGPLEASPEGLPIGVQIIARPYEDELALEVAEELETARGEWVAPPIK